MWEHNAGAPAAGATIGTARAGDLELKGTDMAPRQSKSGAGITGKIVQVGIAMDVARRAGRVAQSREVQQRARELMPAAGRLVVAVRREWSGTGIPTAKDSKGTSSPRGPQDTKRSKAPGGFRR